MKQENETDTEIKGMNHPLCFTSEHVEGYSVNGCFSCSVPVNSSEPCVSLIENPLLFYKKLSEFNKLNGLSLISSAASSVLDLYFFYKEVIMRGGFAQVTKDGRWHEVSSSLNFSNRSPEPPFLLQNIYASLLYNFELIYGIREQENLPAAQGSGDYRDQVGNKVPGVIEKEIECGYLISVTIGTEKLKGLLYHIKDPSVKQFALVRSLMDGVGLEDSAHQLVDWQDLVSSEPPMGSSSKEETKIKPTVKSTAKKVRKDKEAPRATRNPYQFFLHHECDRLKKKHGKNPNINFRQMATDAWKCLTERDRQPYIEESRKDRERFKREMLAYNEHKAMKNDKENRMDGDRIKREMFAYNDRKAIKNDKAEFRILDSETSMNEFHSNHHSTIWTDESSKLFMQNGSMVGFAAQLLENTLEIDAAVKIELDDEFLSVP